MHLIKELQKIWGKTYKPGRELEKSIIVVRYLNNLLKCLYRKLDGIYRKTTMTNK